MTRRPSLPNSHERALYDDVEGQGALFPESSVPRRRSAPPLSDPVPTQRDHRSSTARPAPGRR